MIANLMSDLLKPGASRSPAKQPTNVSLENPAIDLNDPDTWDSLLGGSRTAAGIKVSHSGSLALGAVFQGVSIISGDVACAQMNVVKMDEDGVPEVQKKHPAQRLISEQPNEYQSAFELWRRAMVHALIWGNGFLFIDRQFGSPTGRIMSMYNLLPDRTGIMAKPSTDAGFMYVTEVTDENGMPRLEELRPDEVFHIRGIAIERMGVDMTAAAREEWGLSLAASNFLSQFFAKGGHSGGVLEVPASMSPKSAQNLEDGWKRREAADNWFRTAILRDGAKFHSTTIDPRSAEMHMTRVDQVYEAARFLNLPPSKLGLTETVSYNSQEQDQRNYVTGTLNHWFKTIQSEAKIKLLTERQRKSGDYGFRHDTTQLIEPDIETLTNVLSTQVSATLINPNEGRARLGLPPRDGGDEYGNPNTSSALAGDEPEPAPAEGDDNAEGDEENLAVAAHRMLVHDAVARATDSIAKYVKSQAKKPARLQKWMEDQTLSRERFRVTVNPVLDACNEIGIEVVDDLEDKYFAKLCGFVQNAIDDSAESSWDVLPENVAERCSQFAESLRDWELVT